MDPSTKLRRYIPLAALEELLRDRELRLTRVDRFNDPFEGSVPKQQIDDQVPIFNSTNAMQMMAIASHYSGMEPPPQPTIDPWERMTIRRRAATRSAHASCWTAAPEEAEPQWRLYCNDGGFGQGIALRTTLARLEASVARYDLIVSPITYRLYHTGPAFNDDLDPFLHKRWAFRDEQEVRVLNYNAQHCYNLATAEAGGWGGFGPVPAHPGELPEHIRLGWNALEVIDAIIVSPYATLEYEVRVHATVAKIAPEAEKLIELSLLSERSDEPRF